MPVLNEVFLANCYARTLENPCSEDARVQPAANEQEDPLLARLVNIQSDGMSNCEISHDSHHLGILYLMLQAAHYCGEGGREVPIVLLHLAEAFATSLSKARMSSTRTSVSAYKLR